MNPASPLQLDDKVEIIGPDSYGDVSRIGNRFKISELRIGNNEEFDGGIMASRIGVPWYPVSSLRKVEESQIGDYVEVVGPSITGLTDTIGKRFMIEEIDDPSWPIGLHGYSCHGVMQSIWPASSLRKLGPDEIPCKKEMPTEYRLKCDWCGKYLGNAAIKGQDGEQYCSIPCSTMGNDHRRLSAIEKHLKEIGESHAELIGDVEDVGKRLAFVEAFQRSQIENALDPKTLPRTDLTLGAMIADGTLEVADFRNKDIKTQRKIIKQMEDDLACNGMTCAECMDEVEDIRIAALDYAIRSLRMPDMDNDPEFAHGAADVLEEMMEEMKK
ncbi:hypothetical protein M0R72_19170 [Candidatus Pacearchaeota archaeon]|jgi:hypothetical protein|nr:hypothetical protein [Candidatus Pacearchaeota archaeon]